MKDNVYFAVLAIFVTAAGFMLAIDYFGQRPCKCDPCVCVPCECK